jgi:hypothetical protein
VSRCARQNIGRITRRMLLGAAGVAAAAPALAEERLARRSVVASASRYAVSTDQPRSRRLIFTARTTRMRRCLSSFMAACR